MVVFRSYDGIHHMLGRDNGRPLPDTLFTHMPKEQGIIKTSAPKPYSVPKHWFLTIMEMHLSSL